MTHDTQGPKQSAQESTAEERDAVERCFATFLYGLILHPALPGDVCSSSCSERNVLVTEGNILEKVERGGCDLRVAWYESQTCRLCGHRCSRRTGCEASIGAGCSSPSSIPRATGRCRVRSRPIGRVTTVGFLRRSGIVCPYVGPSATPKGFLMYCTPGRRTTTVFRHSG